MSPDLGRFIQPDPIGFKGDSSNLYRYCGNDWANRTDPMGLIGVNGPGGQDPADTGLYSQTFAMEQHASVIKETRLKQAGQRQQQETSSRGQQMRFRMQGPNDQTKGTGPALGWMAKSANKLTPGQLGMKGVQWAEVMRRKTKDLYGYNFYKMNEKLVWGRSWPGESSGAVPRDVEGYPWPKNDNGSFATFIANGHLHGTPTQDHPNFGTGFSDLDDRASRGLTRGHEGEGNGPVLKRSNSNPNYYDEIDNGTRSVVDQEGNPVH